LKIHQIYNLGSGFSSLGDATQLAGEWDTSFSIDAFGDSNLSRTTF